MPRCKSFRSRGIEDFRFAAPRPLLAKMPLTKKWDGTMIMGISVGVTSLGPKGRQNPVKARWEKGWRDFSGKIWFGI